ncbi:MAG: methyltransferase domain-containing protein [Kiritimatiellia bacterium]
MPLLSDIARRRKIDFFLKPIPKNAAILEIGCGSRWVGEYLTGNGWTRYTGLDLVPPANIVGDIKEWRKLGLAAESFDVIIAFEVVEHVDAFQECHDLLRPGGRLLLTTPVPAMDPVMKLLEWVRLNQKRTSRHDHLVDLRHVRQFADKKIRVVSGLSQWGVFTKSDRDPLPSSEPG